MDSYKKRQERSNNEQIVTLGEENKKMVKQVTLYETKVNKLEREKENLQRKFCEVKEVADKVDDFSSEREKLKSELEALRKDNEELQLSKDSYAKDVEQLDGLNRKMMKLESEKSNYYSENLKMKQELSKLSNNLEFHKANTKKVHNFDVNLGNVQDAWMLQIFIWLQGPKNWFYFLRKKIFFGIFWSLFLTILPMFFLCFKNCQNVMLIFFENCCLSYAYKTSFSNE